MILERAGIIRDLVSSNIALISTLPYVARTVCMVYRLLTVSFVCLTVCCPYCLPYVARYRCTIICIAGGQIDRMCTSVDDMGTKRLKAFYHRSMSEYFSDVFVYLARPGRTILKSNEWQSQSKSLDNFTHT